jgi:hypothetical protein
MKKIVSIVLTTGLLMGAVAFGALACDRGNGPERFPEQKKMGQHDRYQPPMEQQRNHKKMIVKVEVVKPVPIPVRIVRKPVPAPRLGYRFMPRPVPERDRRSIRKPDPERHGHDRQPGPERLGWERN